MDRSELLSLTCIELSHQYQQCSNQPLSTILINILFLLLLLCLILPPCSFLLPPSSFLKNPRSSPARFVVKARGVSVTRLRGEHLCLLSKESLTFSGARLSLAARQQASPPLLWPSLALHAPSPSAACRPPRPPRSVSSAPPRSRQ